VKTGHSHIKAKLREEKAALAGEMSGHIFFVQNYYGFDDGIYAGLRFSRVRLGRAGERLGNHSGNPVLRLDADDRRRLPGRQEVRAWSKRLTAELKRDFPRVIDINGARVIFEDGWGLVRRSSNLPFLVLRSRRRRKSV